MRAQPAHPTFDAIGDALPDPVLLWRLSGELVWANHAAQRLIDPLEAPPQTANRARLCRFVSALAAEDKPSGKDLLMLVDPVQGIDLPMGATANRTNGAGGEPLVVVTLRRDIGEKTLLLANASHELRTPLNAILGYTSLLLHRVHGELSNKQELSLERIDSNAQHLLALINDLLDLSLSDAGKMPVRLTCFDLAQLLREILGELEPIIAKAQLPVYTDWRAALPPICSDRRKVKQIVLNLFTNALKFTRAGEVRVTLSTADGHARVAVADSGIGIAPSDQEKIFEDFRQVESTIGRTHSGAGLGLAICRRFAGLLGGSISVKSELGKGATFTLSLPLEQNHGAKRVWGRE
jgi:signal transduction histidine kinase